MKIQKAILSAFLFVLVWSGCSKKNPTGPATSNITNEFYVSLNGDNGNPGTAEKPWASIPFAIARLKAGDVLVLMKGTYEVSELVRVSLKGKEGAWISIRGEAGETVILDGMKADIPSGSQYPYNNGILQIENASFIRIQNLTVQNSHRPESTFRTATSSTFSTARAGTACAPASRRGRGARTSACLATRSSTPTTWP